MSYIEFNSGSEFIETINVQENGQVIINHNQVGLTDVVQSNDSGEYINITDIDNGGHVITAEVSNIYTDIISQGVESSYEAFYDSDVCEQLLNLEERIDNIGDIQIEYVDGFNLVISKNFGGQGWEDDWSALVQEYYQSDCQIIINVFTESGRGNTDIEIYSSDIYNYNPFLIEGLLYENPIPVNEKVYIKVSINWDIPGWQHVEGEFCGIAGETFFNLDLYGGPTPSFIHYENFVSYRPGTTGIFYVCPTRTGDPVYLDIYEVANSGFFPDLYPIGIYACEGPVDIFDLTKGYKEISINLICLCEYMNGGLSSNMFPWDPYYANGDDLYEMGYIKSKFYLSSRDAYYTYDGFERTQSWINVFGVDGFTYQSSSFNKIFGTAYRFSQGDIELYQSQGYNYVPTIGQIHIVFDYEGFRVQFMDAIEMFNVDSGWAWNGFPFGQNIINFNTHDEFMSSTPSPYELGEKVWISHYDDYYLSEYSLQTGKSDWTTLYSQFPVLVCTDFPNVVCQDYR